MEVMVKDMPSFLMMYPMPNPLALTGPKPKKRSAGLPQLDVLRIVSERVRYLYGCVWERVVSGDGGWRVAAWERRIRVAYVRGEGWNREELLRCATQENAWSSTEGYERVVDEGCGTQSRRRAKEWGHLGGAASRAT